MFSDLLTLAKPTVDSLIVVLGGRHFSTVAKTLQEVDQDWKLWPHKGCWFSIGEIDQSVDHVLPCKAFKSKAMGLEQQGIRYEHLQALKCLWMVN